MQDLLPEILARRRKVGKVRFDFAEEPCLPGRLPNHQEVRGILELIQRAGFRQVGLVAEREG